MRADKEKERKWRMDKSHTILAGVLPFPYTHSKESKPQKKMAYVL